MSERRSVDPRKAVGEARDGGREESKAMRALEEGNPTMHGETLATAGLPIILDGTRTVLDGTRTVLAGTKTVLAGTRTALSTSVNTFRMAPGTAPVTPPTTGW